MRRARLGLDRLHVRGLKRIRLHGDPTILARLVQALSRSREVALAAWEMTARVSARAVHFAEKEPREVLMVGPAEAVVRNALYGSELNPYRFKACERRQRTVREGGVMGIRTRIASDLRAKGWPVVPQGIDRRLMGLHDAVVKLAREVDNLTDEVEQLKRKRAA